MYHLHFFLYPEDDFFWWIILFFPNNQHIQVDSTSQYNSPAICVRRSNNYSDDTTTTTTTTSEETGVQWSSARLMQALKVSFEPFMLICQCKLVSILFTHCIWMNFDYKPQIPDMLILKENVHLLVHTPHHRHDKGTAGSGEVLRF